MRTGNHSKFRLVMQSPITLLVMLVLCFFLGKAAWNMHKTAVVSATKLTQAKNELVDLKSKKADLAQKVEFLSSDIGIETELRLKYRAVRDGESVVVIIDESKNSQAVTASSAEMAAAAAMTSSGAVEGATSGERMGRAEESWWQRIKRFFGGGEVRN